MAATNPGIKTPAEIAADVAAQNSVDQMRAQSVVIGSELAACLCALVLCRLLTVGGLKGLGLHPHQLAWGLVLGTLGYLLVFPLLYLDNIVVTQLYLQAGHDPTVHETVKEIEKTSSFDVRLVFALVAGIGAPLAEEFFFRGLLQTALIQRGWGIIIKFPPDRSYQPPVFQRWASILICSTLFCLLHSIDHMPILFLLSVGLGYLYERTGNLWACVTLHAIFNWWTLVLVLIYS
jgi:membrane protease YdiL (CAAX protease family)